MPLTTTRTLALLGGTIAATLLLAVGVAVGAVPRLVDAAGVATAASAETGAADEPKAAGSDPQAPATTVAPATPVAAPETPVAPPTTARATSRPAPTTTAPPAASVEPAAAPPAPPAPPKLLPGQRVDPTSAQVQAAIAQLHQRIPLFQPNESQLRTFANAVCTSLDQGQTQAQVQSTVRQAVSNIQGESLSAADADFAVRTVVELRCPGWLP